MSDVDIQLPDGRTMTLHFDGKPPSQNELDKIVDDEVKRSAAPVKPSVTKPILGKSPISEGSEKQIPAAVPKSADPTIGRGNVLPTLTAPPKMDTGYNAAFDREYGPGNAEFGFGDIGQSYYNIAKDQQENGLNSLIPATENTGPMAWLQNGAKLGLGLIDTIPAAGATIMGGATDVFSGNPEQEKRGAEAFRGLGQGLIPFSEAVTGLTNSAGTLAAARGLPPDHPARQELEEQAAFERDSAFGSVATMMEQNLGEFALNMAPLVAPVVHKTMAARKIAPAVPVPDPVKPGVIQVPERFRPSETTTPLPATESPVKAPSQPRTEAARKVGVADAGAYYKPTKVEVAKGLKPKAAGRKLPAPTRDAVPLNARTTTAELPSGRTLEMTPVFEGESPLDTTASKVGTPEETTSIIENNPVKIELPEKERKVREPKQETTAPVAVPGNQLVSEPTAPTAETRPTVKPTKEDYEKYPIAETADDVNKMEWYHGTGTPEMNARTIDPAVGDPEKLLMGNGFYLTNNPEIAAGYAKARGKRTGTPSVYRASIKVEGGILHADKPAPDNIRQHFKEVAKAWAEHRDGYNTNLKGVLSNPKATFDEFLKAYKADTSEYSQDNMISKEEFTEGFQYLATDLRTLGYDAITHVGGARTGHTPHQALILLDPQDGYSQVGRGNQIRDLTPLAGGVDEAATLTAKPHVPAPVTEFSKPGYRNGEFYTGTKKNIVPTTAPRVIRGSNITFNDFEKYRTRTRKGMESLGDKRTSELTDAERELYEKYTYDTDSSAPLSEFEAEQLNNKLKQNGRKPRFKEGDQDLFARHSLEENRAERIRRANELTEKAKDGKPDRSLYNDIENLLDDPYSQDENGQWEIPKGKLDALKKYAENHQQEFNPAAEGDFFERTLNDDIPPATPAPKEATVRKSSPLTRDRYFKLRDDELHRGMTPTSKGHTFLKNNGHLESLYNESRKSGLPDKVDYDDAGLSEWAKEHSTEGSVKAGKGVPDDSAYKIPDDAEGNTLSEPKIPASSKAVQKNAMDAGRTTKDTSLITDAEKLHLSSLPASEKAKIEAVRQKAGLRPLFESISDDALVVDRSRESKLRRAVADAKAVNDASIAENKKQIQQHFKGKDFKTSGVVFPTALADIARDVALRIALKSIDSLESARDFVVKAHGDEAKKYIGTIYESAKKYAVQPDDSLLPKGHVRNNKNQLVSKDGEVLPDMFEEGAVQGVRPEILPLSQDKIDKIINRARKPGLNRTKGTKVVKVASDTQRVPTALLNRLKGVFKEHSKTYETEVKPAISASRGRKAGFLDSKISNSSMPLAERLKAGEKVLYGADTPDITVKKLAETLTPTEITKLENVIMTAGLRPFDKYIALKAHQHMVEGTVLRPGERKLLGDVLGKELVGVFVDNRSVFRRNWDRYKTFRDIQTSLMFSADRGSFLRNGVYATANNIVFGDGKMVGKALGRMVSASMDIRGVTDRTMGYRERKAVIENNQKNSPAYQEFLYHGGKLGGIDEAKQSRLYSDDGTPLQDFDNEETFAAKRIIDELAENGRNRMTLLNYADKAGNIKSVVVPISPRLQGALKYMAKAVQAAEYGHNVLLNTYRLESWEKRSGALKELGFTTEGQPDLFQDVARSIMTETGRGEFKTKIAGVDIEAPQNAGIRRVMQTAMLAPRFRKAAWDMTVGNVRKVPAQFGMKGDYELGVIAEKEALALPDSTQAEKNIRQSAIEKAVIQKYSSLPRSERVQSLKAIEAVAILGGGFMMSAVGAGGKVETDLASPDWGKIKWPGGIVTDVFQQNRAPVRLFLLSAAGAGKLAVNTERNIARSPIGRSMGMKPAHKIDSPPAFDPAMQYLIGGASPLVGQGIQALRGKDFDGADDLRIITPVTPPLMLRDLADLGYAGYKRSPGELARNLTLGAGNYAGAQTSVQRKKKPTAGRKLTNSL